MGADAKAQAVKQSEERYHVELVGEHLGMLIGRRGETLDAFCSPRLYRELSPESADAVTHSIHSIANTSIPTAFTFLFTVLIAYYLSFALFFLCLVNCFANIVPIIFMIEMNPVHRLICVCARRF